MVVYRRQIIITFYGTALLTKIDVAVKFKTLQYNIRVTRNNTMLVYNCSINTSIIQSIDALYVIDNIP